MLTVPSQQLAGSLECRGDLAGSPEEPVLLVHGTTLTADTNFDWNYQRAFETEGRPWCTVDLPSDGMADIAVAAEHVTYAIREVSARRGGPVDVVGYSQGGMVPRWSLKYWPDTRAMVDDLVGIDPSNYGTLAAQVTCQGDCPASFWQQRTGSDFLGALNEGDDRFAGIDYSVVYTVTDQVVFPNLPPRPSSGLRDGPGRYAQMSVQALCGVHVADHLSMGTTDPVGYAVVDDALRHDGPASFARVDRRSCLRAVMPGVDRRQLPGNVARVTAQMTRAVSTAPRTAEEPPVPGYAR